MRPAAILFALALAGCGGATPTDEPAMDASAPIDAHVPPDAGPVCEGTPLACSAHVTDEACSAAGCFRSACSGTPSQCVHHYTHAMCAAATGCEWNDRLRTCQGFPVVCSGHRDRNHCLWSDCEWSEDAPCEGTPRPCATLSASECSSAPGCRLVGASDAGPDDAGSHDAGDAGALDAGTDGGADAGHDAGPPVLECTDERTCDPTDPGTCPAGQSCRTVTTAGGPHGNEWTCRPLAATTVAAGEACSDFDQCEPGTFCGLWGAGALRPECRRLCDSHAECDPDELCSLDVTRVGARQSCVGTCVARAGCDLIAQDCPESARCTLFREPTWTGGEYLTLCVPYGGSTDEPPCRAYYDCAPGSVCVQSAVGIEGVCRRVCDPRAPSCPGTTTCRGTFLDLAYCE